MTTAQGQTSPRQKQGAPESDPKISWWRTVNWQTVIIAIGTIGAVALGLIYATSYVERGFGRLSEKIDGRAGEIRKEMNNNTSGLTEKIHQNAKKLEGLKATVSNMKDDVTRMDKKIDRLQERKRAGIGLSE